MVESVTMKAFTITAFFDKIANLVLVSAGILTGFAVIIAVGVVYNSARIGLQERAWELASLRVLGFTRGGGLEHPVRRVHRRDRVSPCRSGSCCRSFIIDLIPDLHSNETFQVPP